MKDGVHPEEAKGLLLNLLQESVCGLRPISPVVVALGSPFQIIPPGDVLHEAPGVYAEFSCVQPLQDCLQVFWEVLSLVLPW